MAPEAKLSRFLARVPIQNFKDGYSSDITEENYFGFPLTPALAAEERLFDRSQRPIAYFSMEYGLSSNTYQPFSSVKPVSEKNFSGAHHIVSNLRAMDYYL